MKLHILSIFGILIGLGIAFSSYWRWLNLYHDPSSAYFGIFAGLTIIAFAIGYNWYRETETEISALKKFYEERFESLSARQDSVGVWFLNKEKELNAQKIVGEIKNAK